MANPITPIGRTRISSVDLRDIVETAARQDRLRSEREEDDYYRRTGLRRDPVREYDPLVPIYGREEVDIADDGDSYDENYRPRIASREYYREDYIEDNPTVIIEDVVELRRSNPAPSNLANIRNNTQERAVNKENEEIKQQIEKKKSEINDSISNLDFDFDF
jgi:hypothetical protein